tara:strand:- start:1329 stop:1766 length:438 start_codon:yes stop_codon:yes gene_type:complete
MKKVIRLTENDLIRLVKKVINEQQSAQDNNKILEKFLHGIDDGNTSGYSRWVFDPNNPNKRSGNVKLTGKEATIRTNYINKPLVWSLMINGKKDKNSIFEIFQSNGKLYYQIRSRFANSSYKELGPNLSSAIQQFNENVSLQKTN